MLHRNMRLSKLRLTDWMRDVSTPVVIPGYVLGV